MKRLHSKTDIASITGCHVLVNGVGGQEFLDSLPQDGTMVTGIIITPNKEVYVGSFYYEENIKQAFPTAHGGVEFVGASVLNPATGEWERAASYNDWLYLDENYKWVGTAS